MPPVAWATDPSKPSASLSSDWLGGLTRCVRLCSLREALDPTIYNPIDLVSWMSGNARSQHSDGKLTKQSPMFIDKGESRPHTPAPALALDALLSCWCLRFQLTAL